MRIFQQQTERLTRAIGNVFLPILKATLPYLNAFLMVLTEIIQWIATLVGYSKEEFDFFGSTDSIGDVSSGISGIGESLDKASESAKKLNGGLRSFDKLNNIKSPTDSSKNGAGAGGGISADILGLFNKTSLDYLNNLDKIKMKATEIRDRIMEWLGFTKLTDEETGDISFKFEKITGGTVLGALGVGGIIYSGLKIITGFFAKIGILTKGLPSLFGLIKTAVVGIAGALGISVGWVVAIGVAIGAVVALIIKYWDEIKAFSIKTITTISDFVKDVWGRFKDNILNPVIEFVTKFATFVYEKAIKPIVDFTVKLAKSIWAIIEKVIEIFVKIGEILVALGKAIYIYVIDPVFDFIGSIATKIYEKAIKPVMDFFKNVGTWVYDNIIKPVWDKIVWLKDKAIGIFKTIGSTISDFIGNSIKAVINGVLWLIERNINRFIRMLNKAIKIINKIPGIPDISYVNELYIPRLKKGMDFVPKDYFPAYLDYGERVLTKEENKEYSKGMNNNKPIQQTFIIKIGDETVANKVISKMNDMARANGEPIVIGE